MAGRSLSHRLVLPRSQGRFVTGTWVRAVQSPMCQHIVLVEYHGQAELGILPNQFASIRMSPDGTRKSVPVPDLIAQHPDARREISDGRDLRKDWGNVRLPAGGNVFGERFQRGTRGAQ